VYFYYSGPGDYIISGDKVLRSRKKRSTSFFVRDRKDFDELKIKFHSWRKKPNSFEKQVREFRWEDILSNYAKICWAGSGSYGPIDRDHKKLIVKKDDGGGSMFFLDPPIFKPNKLNNEALRYFLSVYDPKIVERKVNELIRQFGYRGKIANGRFENCQAS